MDHQSHLLLCWDEHKLRICGSDNMPDRILLPNGTALQNACPDCNEAYFTGFVDYLRNSTEVIGIRYYPFTDYAFVFDRVASQPFIELENRDALLIYWTQSREFDQQLSGDQEFSGNKLFSSDDGRYTALTVIWLPEINFDEIELAPTVVWGLG